MEWLTQNWIWLVLGIGALLMFRRGGQGGHGGHGGCCGGGGHGGGDNNSQHGSTPPKVIASGTPGHQHH